MAFNIRVTGPKILSEESRSAFARVEESIRQFSTHARDTIILIRQPLSMARDHVAILWSHGIALLAFFPYSGTIHGGRRGPWTTKLGDHEQRIENSFERLAAARIEMADVLKRAVIEQPVVAGESGNMVEASTIKTVAIFTGAVTDISLDFAISREEFAALSVDDAAARTMVHIPRLLQAIEQSSVIYPTPELESFADALERSAHFQASSKDVPVTNGASDEHSFLKRTRRSSRALWLLVAAIIVAAIIAFVVLRSSEPGNTTQEKDSSSGTTAASHRPSEIVVELPSEQQMFVSLQQYKTREDLDRALAHGEGTRFLPSNEHVLVFDSTTLAKGVYGYFKIDNAWRKGKLFQTFQNHDTIHIITFLDPLPG